ncbi:MAG: ABC transporter ATP-binding protein [Firmicutes bacterium]|nr:ABC transporter ATP-binding protein [Bacillota bacterium]
MLKLTGIHVYYGRVHALKGISLDVRQGSTVALLGANGAGKTTTLRTVSGLLSPRSGAVEFLGRRIDGRPAEEIVRRGIVQSPEGRQVFPELTVAENLRIGAYTRRDRAGIRQDLERVYQYFPVLAQRASQTAGTLSGGEQQMLAIARALMGAPRLLLLDEPSLGLAPLVTREIFQIIKAINAGGMTVLLVEQNARQALAIADYAYILETGKVVLAGKGTDLMNNEEVRRSYLGERAGSAASGNG